MRKRAPGAASRTGQLCDKHLSGNRKGPVRIARAISILRIYALEEPAYSGIERDRFELPDVDRTRSVSGEAAVNVYRQCADIEFMMRKIHVHLAAECDEVVLTGYDLLAFQGTERSRYRAETR